MKLEPKPAIQATLVLVLWGGLIWLIIILPKQVIVAVFAAVFLPVVVGALWWLMYTIFRDRDRAFRDRDRLKKQGATLKGENHIS
jgi:hypothetical protein